MPRNINETIIGEEDETAYVLRISQSKAEAAFKDLVRRDEDDRFWILAADTIVVVAGTILGKPRDEAEARWMLDMLKGRKHEVLTGVCLMDGCGRVRFLDAVRSEVWMRGLEEDEIDEYVRTGEPFDKAGGYAVQGLAGRFIDRVEGSFSNVVGLPLEKVEEVLGRYGIIEKEEMFR